MMSGATARTSRRTMTAAQLLAAGDIGHCELIRGELVMMSPAGGEHRDVAMEVAFRLKQHVNAKQLGKVYAAETGFLIEQNPDTVLAPDVAFVRAERVAAIHRRGFVAGAPDLAVEVVSPGDHPRDVARKAEHGLQHGTRLVWVVDPARQTVLVHRPQTPARLLGAKDTLTGDDVLPDFKLKVADIFGDDQHVEPETGR
jgi:Uma2 family endonuclease